MRKRLWVTLPLCLLAGAAFAAVSVGTAAGGTARATIKATLNIAVDNTDVDHSDPALSYSVLGWQMEQQTCDTLVGYSNHSGSVSTSVSPLGAAGMPVVLNGGKKYVFTIKSGLHFSNGDAVTAANYKYAFDRDALKGLNSPVTAFMGGVVGWTHENDNASVKTVSGVSASGQKLTISLTKADGTMLPKLALPFFCPITKHSGLWTGSKWKDSEFNGAFPGNGPYYLKTRNVGSQMVLARNMKYSGPKLHKATTIVMNMNLSTNTAYNGISNGTYASDANGNPEPANNHSLFNTYGKNKSRFWVESTMIISYTVMNQARPTFAPAHVKLRKAWNNVIDRPGALNISGYLSGTPQTQALPKALAGTHFAAAYKYPITTPNGARFSAATAQGSNCAGGSHINFWHGSSSPALLNAALIKTNLENIGCVVTDTAYTGYGRYTAAGIKGNAMDIMTAGWSDDYPDGFDWFGILFDGRTIGPDNNNDLAYLKSNALNAKTDACNAMSGTARTNCWGAEDQWQTDNLASWATISATNFVDYIAPNAHNYKYNGPFASAELGLLYQS